ncbi:MAG: hypothetical protein V4505_20030 [Pseudomonadota bacterium]
MSRIPNTPVPPFRREPQFGEFEALETSDRAFTLAQRKRDIARSLDALRSRTPKARRILPNGQREMGVAQAGLCPA